jgi:hypothetical protein
VPVRLIQKRRLSQRTGTGAITRRSSGLLDGATDRQFIRAIGYSPFTAADGKIPLSMVQVKFKPQYVVFDAHLSTIYSRNTGVRAVESANSQSGRGVCRANLPPNRCSGYSSRYGLQKAKCFQRHSLKASPRRPRVQGIQTGANPGLMCILWTFSAAGWKVPLTSLVLGIPASGKCGGGLVTVSLDP